VSHVTVYWAVSARGSSSFHSHSRCARTSFHIIASIGSVCFGTIEFLEVRDKAILDGKDDEDC